MKSLRIQGILILAGIMLTAFTVNSILPKAEKSPYITRIEEQEDAKNIRFYGKAGRVLTVAVPGVLLVTLLIGVSCWGRAHLKKASVHTYKIAENEIVIHERDLSLAAPIAMGLMNAEQLKQMNGGIDKAFELYERMAQIQTQHFRALGAGSIPQDLPAMLPESSQSVETPTFSHLLNHGDIQPGKPMILGFEDGTPRQGSFLDIYSAAVAGESGSGKTATLLYLIGSGIIADRVRFYGIDPHYPHPKSLGYKTKPLWEAGLMSMATYKDDMLNVFKTVETIIEKRLKQLDTDETPVVLVIDELAFLNKTSIGKPLAHVMERISTEGRKCAVYMLASSQTWLVSRTGDSSAVRDTLTSAYVHRIKPKQANLLLQSKEISKMVEKYVKKPGECLLYPVCDDPVICTMPLTTEQDMKRVANMIEPIFANAPVNAPVNVLPVNQPVNQPVNLTTLSDTELVNQVNARLKKGDLNELVEIVGVSKPMLSYVLNGKRDVSEKVRSGFINYLEKIVPFPEGGKD